MSGKPPSGVIVAYAPTGGGWPAWPLRWRVHRGLRWTCIQSESHAAPLSVSVAERFRPDLRVSVGLSQSRACERCCVFASPAITWCF